MTNKKLVMGRIDHIKDSLKSIGKPLVRKVRGVDHGRDNTAREIPRNKRSRVILRVHQGCLIAGLLQLRADPEWKLVDVIARPTSDQSNNEKTQRTSGETNPVESNQYKETLPILSTEPYTRKDGILRAEQLAIEIQRHTWQHIPQKKPLQYGSVEWRSSAPGFNRNEIQDCIVSLSSRCIEVKNFLQLKQVTGGLLKLKTVKSPNTDSEGTAYAGQENHVSWTQQQWASVLFTDESRFTMESDSGRLLIWREQRTRYHQSNTVERHSYRGGGILVWAGISLGGHTDLHVFHGGTVTGLRYRDGDP
ncbi:uncharacterized protein TNCV_2221081 [Trichonephila clavipes]|nr:uncharacterized protein TNCV_2221081 [Trichonephila clavipes]